MIIVEIMGRKKMVHTDGKLGDIIGNDTLSDQGCTPSNFMGEVAPDGIDEEMRDFAEGSPNSELEDGLESDKAWNLGWG